MHSHHFVRRLSLCQVGTALYMSPERLDGQQYSYAADLWAYGLILLELACGRYPYPKFDSMFQLSFHIIDAAAPTLPAGGRLSDSFGQLLALCLDKQPQMRPSARDLLKHPWFRQPDPLELRAGSGGGARHDASARQALDRSRSNLQDLDVSAMLGTMNLGQDC